MAMTQEELKKAQLKQTGSTGQSSAAAGSVDLSQASPQGGQSNLAGVSQSTLAGLQQYGQSYTPSASVTQAQNYLQSVMGQKPGEYQSNYAAQIESLYNQIMNRPKFSYDVNKDPLFQGYKTQYVQQGQKAMQDTVGAASALTGGYGNSWAATAGSQAYQAYLQQLNNLIPEMEARAYSRYQGEGDELRANMNVAQALDEMAYGRYRDTVSDWQADRTFANAMYNQEKNWDMSDWNRLQNYYQNMASMENSSYWQGQNLAEQQRQYDADAAYRQAQADLAAQQWERQFAETQRQYDTDAAYRQAQADLAADQWLKQYQESVRQYNQNFDEDQRQYDTSLAEKQRQFDIAQALDQAEFDLQLRKYEDALAQAAGSGGSGGSVSGGSDLPKDNNGNNTNAGWYTTTINKLANKEISAKDALAKFGLGGQSKTPATIKNTMSDTEKEHKNYQVQGYGGMTQKQIDNLMEEIRKATTGK
ncbi:MAG: hypothetical protein IKH57_21245 [Clostridia bacterium]|nr:hypothetical protein [Clostridia bacterium]